MQGNFVSTNLPEHRNEKVLNPWSMQYPKKDKAIGTAQLVFTRENRASDSTRFLAYIETEFFHE